VRAMKLGADVIAQYNPCQMSALASIRFGSRVFIAANARTSSSGGTDATWIVPKTAVLTGVT